MTIMRIRQFKRINCRVSIVMKKTVILLIILIYINSILLNGCQRGGIGGTWVIDADKSNSAINAISGNTTGQGVIIEIPPEEPEAGESKQNTDNNMETDDDLNNKNVGHTNLDDNAEGGSYIDETLLYEAVEEMSNVNATKLSKNLELSGITEDMLSFEFWIKQEDENKKIISSLEYIQATNKRNIETLDFLHNIFSLKNKDASWIKTQILSLSKPSASKRYTEEGRLLGKIDYDMWSNDLNIENISGKIQYGLITVRTNMRTWPTNEKVYDSQTERLYDRFQETAVYVAEPVAILHESRDGKWYFVAMYNYMGWISSGDVAIGDVQEIYEYSNSQDFLLITASKLFIQNSEENKIQLDMGVKLPLVGMKVTERLQQSLEDTESDYIVKMPRADSNGNLVYYYAKVCNNYDVKTDYMDYTTSNIVTQAFKLITEEYGWGGENNVRDCSAFIMDVFRCFGINLPRNTGQQEQAEGNKVALENTSPEVKSKIFEEMRPGTVLYMNNHTMLYLGKYNNKEYIIHDIPSVYEKRNGKLTPIALEQVAITPLSILTKRGTSYRDLLTDAILYSVETDLVNQTESGKSSSINNNSLGKIVDRSLERLFSKLDSEQIILSKALNADGFKVAISLYEKNGGEWICTDADISGVLGKNGIGKKREGDNKSPTGIFSIGSAFGFGEQQNLEYPYFKINNNSFWVDDPNSSYYNQLVNYLTGYYKDWNSAEKMSSIPQYKYGLVINYNLKAKQNAGSAIFMHTYKNEQSPTQGCTAVNEDKMKQIIDWLDYNKHPLFIQGTEADFINWSEGNTEQPVRLPEGFVYVRDFVPDITEALAYASTHNFTGRVVPGYFNNTSILTLKATQALKNVQEVLNKKGYSLLIYDAYRPTQAVESFVQWTQNPSDIQVKEIYYPDLDKTQLIPQGYIGKVSAHSRGSTVDVSIIDLKTGKELDMGSFYDFFGEITRYDSLAVNEKQRQNRKLLKDVMEANGFSPYVAEWWHFRLTNEQFPNKPFNFPVKR